MDFNIHKIVNDSSIYGPYKRTVIWFEGCSLRCKNCINPELWNRNDNNIVKLNQVIDSITNDHVTLLGGEPLEQENISSLIDELSKRDIGIILFTGYSLNELSNELYEATKKCDVVISERYIEELHDDSLYLRGSKNQLITFNTTRYSKDNFNKPNSYEVLINNENLQLCGRNKKFIADLLDL